MIRFPSLRALQGKKKGRNADTGEDAEMFKRVGGGRQGCTLLPATPGSKGEFASKEAVMSHFGLAGTREKRKGGTFGWAHGGSLGGSIALTAVLWKKGGKDKGGGFYRLSVKGRRGGQMALHLNGELERKKGREKRRGSDLSFSKEGQMGSYS